MAHCGSHGHMNVVNQRIKVCCDLRNNSHTKFNFTALQNMYCFLTNLLFFIGAIIESDLYLGFDRASGLKACHSREDSMSEIVF